MVMFDTIEVWPSTARSRAVMSRRMRQAICIAAVALPMFGTFGVAAVWLRWQNVAAARAIPVGEQLARSIGADSRFRSVDVVGTSASCGYIALTGTVGSQGELTALHELSRTQTVCVPLRSSVRVLGGADTPPIWLRQLPPGTGL